ncbi:hypothetical protein Tco_1055971 [Tanacetum coccineum]|uniref:Uncharacterized protein n=1 Tax=Tanacetum coccineum TaxID=301880 RepID=A0ABQ5H2D8_9ASTR
MPSAFLTQGTVYNIPIVFSWSDSIRPEDFLSFVLLWLVIIVAVVDVTVVVVIIVAVVVVVESSSVIKLSFSDGKIHLPSSGIQFGDSWAKELHQDRASSVIVPVANFTLQSSVQLLQENTDLVLSNQRMRPIAPSIPLKLIDWQLMNSL